MGVLPVIVFLIVGAAVLFAMRISPQKIDCAGFLAFAFYTAIVVFSFALILPAVLTSRIYFFFIYVILAGGVVGLVLLFRSGTASVRFLPLGPLGNRWGIAKIALLAIVILICVFFVFDIGRRVSIVGFDAIGNYAMKGKMWFVTGYLRPNLLTDPEFVTYHRRYPPAIPLMEGVWAKLTFGGWQDTRIKFFFLFCWLGAGMMVWAHLRPRNSVGMSLLAAAMWIAIPYHVTELQGGGASAYPEIPYILALLASWLAVKEIGSSRNRLHGVLLGLLVGGTLLIKKEGLIFTVLILVHLAWMRAPLFNIFSIVCGAVAAFVLTALAHLGLPAHLDESYFGWHLTPIVFFERIGVYCKAILDEFMNDEHWGKFLPFTIVLVWIYKAAFLRKRALFINRDMFMLVALTLSYDFVLLNTPLDFKAHLDSTMHRLWLHILPFLLIATFDGLREPDCSDGDAVPEA